MNGKKILKLSNLLLALLLAAGLSSPTLAPSKGPAVRLQTVLAEIAASDPSETVRVIVQKATGSEDAEAQVAALGGRVTSDLHIIHAFAAEMTAEAAVQLARMDSIRWISLDAPMQSTAAGNPTVRDEFGVASYNNNNGNNAWATNWIEMGDSAVASATSGYVKIASGQLQFSSTSRKLSRAANLTGATSATLSFQYKRNGLDDATDYVALEVSGNGGASWTELARYKGAGTDSAWQAASFNILAFAASNTTIRFSTSSTLGTADYLYVDNVQIEYSLPPIPSGGPDGMVNTGALLNAYNATIGADKLWALGYQGSAVTVAVIDSGINPNADFFTSAGVNRQVADIYFNSDFNQNSSDGYGHGTLVASIVGGDGSDSNGNYIGVAPMSKIINVKVSNDDGSALMKDVVLGLQWVLDNKDAYEIRVVNLSLNSSVAESYHTSPLDAAVEILWFNGIVVVSSGGNQGNGAIYPPANDPFIITVGATSDAGTRILTDDSIPSFSAYGTTGDGYNKPDLVAPGKDITARLVNSNMGLAKDHPANKVGSQYFRMSGTSTAAPIVSGAVALLLQDEPALTPDQVKYRLISTANKNWPGFNVTKAGAGYLDIYAAVNGTSTESANTGLPVSQLLSTGSEPITWGSAGWNSVGWNTVGWNTVGWNTVGWNTVGWNSDYWGP